MSSSHSWLGKEWRQNEEEEPNRQYQFTQQRVRWKRFYKYKQMHNFLPVIKKLKKEETESGCINKQKKILVNHHIGLVQNMERLTCISFESFAPFSPWLEIFPFNHRAAWDWTTQKSHPGVFKCTHKRTFSNTKFLLI